MTRFGDFTLLEDLGRSAVSDRYRAMHTTQGGPFFLKVYTRLDVSMHADLLARCERLIGQSHEHLARHLGHGIVDGLPFVVSPFLDGLDLGELSTSLKDRRVVLGLDTSLLLLGDLAEGVGALHAVAAGHNGTAHASAMPHGDVSLRHVRLGPEGQVWLTGLTTPRGDGPGRPPDGRWDLAGVGALVYDLVPILRSGGAREPLPVPLDRVVRRALGIGPREDHLTPADLTERLDEVSRTLELRPDRGAFAELVRRTMRAIEKRLAESGKHPIAIAAPSAAAGPRGLPSDDIPSLDPVDLLPTLEPVLEAQARRPPMAPAVSAPRPPPRAAPPAMPELIPISTVERPAVLARESEATTRLVDRARGPSTAQLPQVPVLARTSTPGQPYRVPPPPRAAPPAGSSPVAAQPVSPPPVVAPPLAVSPVAAPPVAAPPVAARSVSPPPLAPSGPLGGELPPDLDEPFASLLPPRPEPPPRRDPPPRPAPPPAAAPTAAPSPARSPATTPPPAPPPLPSSAARRAPIKRPLLADPDEPRPQSVNPALTETTRDATDPEQRTARTEQLRRDPAIAALLRAGTLTERALESAIAEHLQRGGRVLEILVAQNATSDAIIADTLAAAAQCPRISDQGLKARRPAPALAKRMPQTYLLARRVLPLGLDHGKLSLAVADPFDRTTVEELKSLLQATSVELCVAARAAITAATVEVYRALSGAGTDTDAPTVLVCTPDESKATRIGGRLVQEGMRVEHVVDGLAAEEILRNRAPTAILCVHDLPSRNAQALLMLARERPATAELPFFVLGPRDDAIATRLLDLGADDYFGEPLRLEVVLAKLRRAVGKGQSRSSAEGSPVNDRSGIFSTPPQTANPIVPTPLPTSAPVPRFATTAPKVEPAFLENITAPFSMGGLDDLPELPPDFAEDDVLQPAAPSMPTGVMGTLRQMPVPEIVQSLEMGRKTARVDLVPSEGEKGMIAFETGAIRYAECGALRGDEAFFMLARHKEGFFRIHYGDKPPAVNIDAPTTFLLLEAMRRMDEEGQDLGKR